eukprot:TRINITY_DN9053_c0_g1_i4.p1 TRINITY_DN9053_c0_g1~~TRINITY_DN9053_c0_g1_i4.p1  ORF type:complete len:233 (+),score=68.04 TRINITY_DN9053_c0_g1_i4:45-743(+)
MLFILLLLPDLSSGEEDPCMPNPCGDNTRCASSYNGANPVISCECLIGYHVPDGGDPFDGCIEQSVAGGTSRGGGGAAAPPISTTVHSTEATIPPLSTLGSVVRESADQPSAVPRALDNADNTNRLQAGHRPGQLLPRRKTKPTVDFEDVDTKELFPEDCLVHEDCEVNEFCSPPPENKCVDACTLDVCGVQALCTSALHRPVCSCPDGFEGNAYDKCTKTKSRVGMKFRRK